MLVINQKGWRSVGAPNKACTGLAGTRRVFKRFLWLQPDPLKWLILSLPPAGNANRWAERKKRLEVITVTQENEDLVNAIEKKDYDKVRSLLENLISQNVDINEIRDKRYEQPLLTRFLRDGRIELAKLAISAHADVNARSYSDQSALNIATEKGYTEIVELLISKGANVNAQDKDGYTPLLQAARGGSSPREQGGYKDIVEILLKSGADVNTANNYGHTPFMYAAASGDIAIMDLLISSGADINAKDKNGHGAIYSAITYNRNAAIEYLKSKGVGTTRSQKLQGILSFSRTAINDWDTHLLHDNIQRKQIELGYIIDNTVFKRIHVVAGASLDDLAYIYAAIRQHFAHLGGGELISRCYINDFQASDGNSGKYVIILDKSIQS